MYVYFFSQKERKSAKKEKKPINYLILGKIWLSYRYFCQF